MSRETNIVIPVKDPRGAKSRMGDWLSPRQREELALTLVQQTLLFFRDFSDAHHILVVTDSDSMKDLAEESGATVLFEVESSGETAAVNKATRWSLDHGFRRQLVVPADMASWDRTDIERLLAMPAEQSSLVLCPATGDNGTNAVLSCPPDVVPFRFGDKSFPEYQVRARERQVLCTVLRLRSLVLDLDTPDDLDCLLQQDQHGVVRALVDAWNLPVR